MPDRQGNRSRYDTEVGSWCMFGHESASRMAYESPGEYPAQNGRGSGPQRAPAGLTSVFDTLLYRI